MLEILCYHLEKQVRRVRNPEKSGSLYQTEGKWRQLVQKRRNKRSQKSRRKEKRNRNKQINCEDNKIK